MKPQVQKFKRVAAQACSKRGFSFTEFMQEYGLEDILIQADAEDWPAQQIAGQVLFHCCIEEGNFNNFQVGVLSVMTFLNEEFGRLGQGEQQAFQDLANILNKQGTLEAIEGWINTHYP